MQTIQVRYQYYPGGVSTWIATSNNPPEGKSSSASGNGYTYSAEETRQQAIGNAGYFGYTSEDTIYVNGIIYQAGSQTITPPQGQRYCADAATIAVWNQIDNRYDTARCSTGYCEDGYCVEAPTVELPYKPPIAGDLCPRGNTYPAAIGAKIWGCDEGYDWIPAPVTDFFNTGDCVCRTYAQTPEGQEYIEQKKETGLGMGLGEIIKMLPQLLIVMVIVSIIGAFRK